ncbi:pilin assembly protein [Pseudomonas stutzeri]|nr:pilin assembly protein [Stutzerimonas stutzeri]
MKIRDLVGEWELSAKGRLSKKTYSIPLDLESAARLAALAEMYPKRRTEELLGELVGVALQELEESFPYVKGSKVVATDEQGDPLYEDAGPTPRFLALARKHLEVLKQQDDDNDF